MFNELTKPQAVLRECIPAKQVALAHVIANPNQAIYKKLGLNDSERAIGILSITPGEATIIASDIAIKSGAINISFIDRSCGSVIVTGDISSVEYALKQVTHILSDMMDFIVCPVTRT